MISAIAVMLHENMYSRYSDIIVWKYANTVYTHITRNTHEPIITMAVGTALLPMPREAAIVQSINAENAYEKPITHNLSMPICTTSGSVVNSMRNLSPNISSIPPSTAPMPNE